MGDDGNACSDEGNDSGEEGKGSVVVGGNGSGAEVAGSGAGGSGAVCVDGAGSLEGSVGSDHGGRATSSTDSCACVARTTAKNVAATSTDVLPTIMWAKRWMYRALPKRMAARLDWRHMAVNQKILVKIGYCWRGFYRGGRHRTH